MLLRYPANGLIGKGFKTTEATYLTRTGLDGYPVIVSTPGSLAYTRDSQGNLVRADGTAPTSYTFDTEGNAINAGGAPSGAGVVTDNTIFGGEAGESIYGLSGNGRCSRSKRHPQKGGCQRALRRICVL